MPKTNQTDPTGILPGDTIRLTVLGPRALPQGIHEAEVVVSKVVDGLYPELIIVTRDTQALISLKFIIPADKRFIGRGFLAADEYPVAYEHIPNVERRLELSLAKAKRKE